MKFDESKFKKMNGYEEGKDVLDPVHLTVAADYKKNVLKNLVSIFQTDIDDRFKGDEYFVSRKYDGEYAIIFHSRGRTVTVNRSGRTRRGIPCIEEAGRLIEAAGIVEGIFPAEIYVEAGYKTRVNDLVSALSSKGDITTLRLAVFDILEIDGRPFPRGYYPDTSARLHEIFGGGRLCHPADMLTARSAGEIKNIWKRWVEGEGSEGLVVHSRVPMSYKIKPRHFFDAVVIAYGAGSGDESEQVRRMLFAFMPGAGRYMLMSRVGSGLYESLRKQLFEYFQDRKVVNPIRGMNPKWDELVFVRPDLVIEVAVEEIVTEMASGEKTNVLLSFDGGQYRFEGIVAGYRTYTPVFIRLREDKSADEHDAGTGQIDRFLVGAGVRTGGSGGSGGSTGPGAEAGFTGRLDGYGRAGESAGADQETHRRKSWILLRDVLRKPGRKPSEEIFAIWERRGEYVLYTSLAEGRSVERTIVRSDRFFDLFDRYRAGVKEALDAGYVHDTAKGLVSDRCVEIMNTAYEEVN